MPRACAAVCLLALLIACRGDEAKAPVATPNKGSGSVRLTPDVVASARIKVEPAWSEHLTGSIEVVGEVSADPDRMANIASPVAGRLEDVLDAERRLRPSRREGVGPKGRCSHDCHRDHQGR